MHPIASCLFVQNTGGRRRRGIYTASINTQDSDWLGTETDFATLFSPWKLGNIELSHRMVKSAAGSATYLAGYTDELFDYYVNLAKGGVEMIWVEGEAFTLGEDSTFGAEALDFGKRLMEACAEYGSHLGYQWAPFGSSVAEDAMTVEQIQAMEDVAATYATQLKEMGFEAVEINAADMVANIGLLDEVSVAETYAIGDCANPFNIALAIRGGNDAGRAL